MFIQRDIYSKIKPFFDSPEAVIITGMRRVGKTTLVKQIMENIDSKNKVFLDLENPANQKYLEEKNYEKILDNLKFLGLNVKKRGYVFLDEIQFVKNIPSVVKYLSDHHNIKFFLTGSASFYLKNLFSESLAGRKYIFEIYPFSFGEFLTLKNAKISIPPQKENVTEAMFEEINRYYDEYAFYGGFPGVIKKESAQEKKLALGDIFSSYFQLEVMQLGDFRRTNIVRDLIMLMMNRIGSRMDVQKISRELGVSRITIYNYISFLENTYFIKLIRPFSRSRDTEIRSAPKVYLCDSGLANHFAKVSEGALFENIIFAALRQRGEVNYYQRKSGVEIDFILNKEEAYEIKISPDERDSEKLRVLADELKLKKYKIVSRKYTEIRNAIYGFML